jgi:hypothetical protein
MSVDFRRLGANRLTDLQPSGLRAVLGGGYLMARGMDNMRTGYQEWRTGQQQSTWFAEAGRRTAKGVGAENSTAENVGSWTELGASVVEFFLTLRAGGKIKEWQKQPPKVAPAQSEPPLANPKLKDGTQKEMFHEIIGILRANKGAGPKRLADLF